MTRLSPGDPVEWVSRSGIRREGEILEQLPRGQWLVRPDGSLVDQAVDAADLSRRGVTVEPAPPSLRATTDRPPAPRPAARPAARRAPRPDAGECGRRGGLATQAKRRAATATAAAPGKNPAAVALGKLGGSKGGKATAANRTPAERSLAARGAAEARWGVKPPDAPAHGTRNSYRRGCRCAPCRAAHAEHQREYNRRARERARGGSSELAAYFDVRAVRSSPWGPVEQVQLGRLDGRRMGWREVWEVLALHRPGCWALQVFPDADHLIDEVDCYHLWVLPRGVVPEPLTINAPAEATA